MKIFSVEVQHSLFLDLENDFKPSIHRKILVHGPVSVEVSIIEPGYVSMWNHFIAPIDNKNDIKYSQSLTISKESMGMTKPSGFFKVLHAHGQDYHDEDKDIVVCMRFTEHHDMQNYCAFFPTNTIIKMLNIDTQDILKLGYTTPGDSIHYVFFILRDDHITNGILGGNEILKNRSGELIKETR